MLVASIILFIIFLIHTFLMLNHKWDKLDQKFYQSIHFNEIVTKVLKKITMLANNEFFIVLSILLLIILHNKLSLVIVIGLIIDAIIVWLVKHIIKRDRPNVWRLIYEKGYSYASGHAFTATFFYSFIIFLIIISNLILPLKIIFIMILLFLILTIIYSRVYLGVHYLSDVIGGLFLGISYLLLYIFLTFQVFNLF